MYTLTLHATAPRKWNRLPYTFHPLETDEQTTCLALYNEFIVDPFRAAFPKETLFCEPSALFSDGNAPTVAAKVLVIGFFATSRFFQEPGDGGTTACCNARFGRLLGQMPHRVGRSAVHLYEHQGRIEMQHPGISCPNKCLSLATQSYPSNILFRLFLTVTAKHVLRKEMCCRGT